MDCSLPGSSVHGILQARILEWVPFSRIPFQPRDRTQLLHCKQILYHLSHLYLGIMLHGHKTRFRDKKIHSSCVPNKDCLMLDELMNQCSLFMWM